MDATGITPENYRDWVAEQIEKFGDVVPLEPLPLFTWRRRDPMKELTEMVSEDKVIVLTPWPMKEVQSE